MIAGFPLYEEARRREVTDARYPEWTDACTIGAATGDATRDGGPLVFSTSDDPFTTRTRLVVVDPGDGYCFIATQIVSPPPPVSFNQMHTRGVNEAGLAYTWAYVTPGTEPDDERAIGIPYYQFGRLLLSRAATVEQALGLVEEYPRAYHGNFIFADAGGAIALVEISTHTFHVESHTTNGAFARSNHWISPRMRPLDARWKQDPLENGVERGVTSTEARYARASELIDAQAGAIDATSLQAIASDHAGKERGHSICSHGSPNGAYAYRGGTVSSEISEPAKRRLWYCYGWPCGAAPEQPEAQLYQEHSWGTYLPFDLDDLVPGEYVTTDGRLTGLGVGYLGQTRAARAGD